MIFGGGIILFVFYLFNSVIIKKLVDFRRKKKDRLESRSYYSKIKRTRKNKKNLSR